MLKKIAGFVVLLLALCGSFNLLVWVTKYGDTLLGCFWFFVALWLLIHVISFGFELLRRNNVSHDH